MLSIDIAITVCDHARDQCPVFLGKHQSLHWGFEDPVGGDKDKFREIRDLIVEKFKSELEVYL